jgi:hypothetical protein
MHTAAPHRFHHTPHTAGLPYFFWAALFALGLFVLTPGAASAATCTRLLESNFLLRAWDDASRWDCGNIPAPADTAILPTYEQFVELPPNLALNRDLSLARFEMYSGRIEGRFKMTITQAMIWSGGDIHYTNTTPFVSPSATIIAPSATLTVRISDTLLSSTGTFTNLGEIDWVPATLAAGIPQISGGKVSNQGNFAISAGDETWSVRVDNFGTLTVNSSGKPMVGSIFNHAQIELQNGTLKVGSFEQVTGTTSFNGGTLDSTNFDGLIVRAGRIGGKGEVRGFLDNRGGTLAPTGILRIGLDTNFNNAYTQAPAATLFLDISGTQRGTDYGSLNIVGITSISGTLAVSFTNGFVPDPTDGFIVAVCDPECTGEFAVNSSGLPIHYNTNYIVIGANIPLPVDPKLFIPSILTASN